MTLQYIWNITTITVSSLVFTWISSPKRDILSYFIMSDLFHLTWWRIHSLKLRHKKYISKVTSGILPGFTSSDEGHTILNVANVREKWRNNILRNSLNWQQEVLTFWTKDFR